MKTLPEVMRYRGQVASVYRKELKEISESLRCIEERRDVLGILSPNS